MGGWFGLGAMALSFLIALLVSRCYIARRPERQLQVEVFGLMGAAACFTALGASSGRLYSLPLLLAFMWVAIARLRRTTRRTI